MKTCSVKIDDCKIIFRYITNRRQHLLPSVQIFSIYKGFRGWMGDSFGK